MSNLFKHLKTTHPESYKEAEQKQEDTHTSISPAPPSVQEKMLQESFQRSKAYPGSTIISYYLCQGNGRGYVFNIKLIKLK